MVSHEEMESMIQEWLAQELCAVDLCKTYGVVKSELEKQLEVCMSTFTEGDNNK